MANLDLEGTLNNHMKESVIPDYGNVILSIIRGNKEVFVSADEILLMHKINDQIKELKKELLIYQGNININEILSF